MSVIPSEGVGMFWPEVEPLLAPATAYSGGRINVEDLRERFLDGRYLLWAAHDGESIKAAFATRIAVYPRRRMLAVECAGGKFMSDWIDLVQQTFRNFARDMGLDGVEMYGREGWTRVLSRYGWKRAMVVMEVDRRVSAQEVGE
jgi:hypothetical protein